MAKISVSFLGIVCSLASLSSCFYKKGLSTDYKYQQPATAKDLMPHKRNSLEWWYFAQTPLQPSAPSQMFTLFKRNYFVYRSSYMVNAILSDSATQKAQKIVAIFKHSEAKRSNHDSVLVLQNKNVKLEFIIGVNKITYQYQDKANNINLSGYANTQQLIEQGPQGYIDFKKSGRAGYLSTITDSTLVSNPYGNNLPYHTWFDKQWNCLSLVGPKSTWQWLGAHFEDGASLMVFNYDNQKKKEKMIYACYTQKNGKPPIYFSIPYENWKVTNATTVGNKKYPISVSVQMPALGKTLTINTPSFDHETNINYAGINFMTYWEIPCKLQLTDQQGSVTAGKGFLEITNSKLK